ncbi:hypothetical protein Barb4_04408 [Bacteroidales bacterium Barb4]|nr:hypothetical protein Barb4_04408 [Bacteroidales bacterium Barb4]
MRFGVYHQDAFVLPYGKHMVACTHHCTYLPCVQAVAALGAFYHLQRRIRTVGGNGNIQIEYMDAVA